MQTLQGFPCEKRQSFRGHLLNWKLRQSGMILLCCLRGIGTVVVLIGLRRVVLKVDHENFGGSEVVMVVAVLLTGEVVRDVAVDEVVAVKQADAWEAPAAVVESKVAAGCCRGLRSTLTSAPRGTPLISIENSSPIETRTVFSNRLP